ncbi:MAG TPA: PepSY1/2 domain-containing protein, partial [Limnochordia bacterium]|nr:PepSY1/2 domain-containing protein [Limnochordia bacterium]
SAALHEIQREAAKGSMPWGELQSRTRRRLRQEEQPDAGFTRLEDHFQQIPVIQYDGPFSDHVLQRKPRGLTGDDVSEEEAERIALEFVVPERRDGYRAEAVRRVEGRIPAYGIVVRPEETGVEVVMDVSVKGGHVVWMLTKRDVKEAKLSFDEAIERARAFLRERGFAGMEATYLTEAENVAVIPFVPVKGGVRIYPDLVKVSVALDNGEIVGFEAMGYLMAHHERTIPAPEITPDEARERVAMGLEVTGEVRLAVIPTETLDEVLTWEVPASLGGDRFLVYINAQTGDEEQILRIVRTSEGETTL